ncbi:ArnT family glycosyltransferase [Sulfurirhabdus autotrophica]|uniref:Dolichyl-phosphate-mannose-protein mannosyltransferase n=1 Tax=Sulfurirhabdus autotrophica TaxID=1706046 RepID=A0A4R3YBL3_9PROT|nr:glycosyltransferase family 39 protein [Sulfurirhabdus autotrophica]TCV88134.1 dolichyl-phosphate-mannose-protein mannosyltransferase [Sulfurirhabdus autotrophica]
MKQNSSALKQTQKVWKRLADMLPIVGITMGFFLFFQGIAQPWIGLDGSDGALFSSIAHNYLQFGVFDLNFGQLITFEEISHPGGTYYLHHPPLFPLLVMTSFSLFGEAEIFARLVSVLATLATAIVLFALVKKAANTRVGIMSVFFFMTYPSTILFGRKPGYEALTLFFVILAVWLYLKYRDRPSLGTMFLLFCAVAAGAASDWAAYFLPPAILTHYLLMRKDQRMDWTLLSGLIFVPTVTLILFLISIYYVDKESLLGLLHQGLAYTGFISANSEIAKTIIEAKITFSPKEYFFRIVQNFNTDFGIISALLALIGIVFIRRNKEMSGIVIILSVVAFGILVIFWRSLYFHQWWMHLMTVPLAILSAEAINSILSLADNDRPSHEQATKAGITVAVILPVLISMLFNVWQLGNIQTRIQREDRLEKPDFIPELGHYIRRSTAIGDQILTNLAPISKYLTNPYSKILPYYSRRTIHPSITTPDQIFRLISQENNRPKGAIYFLLELDVAKDLASSGLYTWLKNNGDMTALNIQGHSFQLFRLKTINHI